jgi:hypothetical protein
MHGAIVETTEIRCIFTCDHNGRFSRRVGYNLRSSFDYVGTDGEVEHASDLMASNLRDASANEVFFVEKI